MREDIVVGHRRPVPRGEGPSLFTGLFVLLTVLIAMSAFYFLFAKPPEPGNTAVQPSARDNLAYVGLWFLVYGAAGLIFLHDAWKRGINPRFLLLIPFVVYVVFSALWAVDPSSCLIFAGMLALNAVIAAALDGRVSPRYLLTVMAWTVVVLCAVSLVMLFAAPGIAVSTPDRPGLLMNGELTGVFAHKAALGRYAAMALLVLVFLDQSRWRLRALGIAILVVALVLSNSMSTAMGGLVAGVILAIANRAGRYRNAVLGVPMVLFVVFSVILPFVDFSLLAEAAGRGPTLTGRTDFWRFAGDFIAERPLLGFGFNSFFTPVPFSPVWDLRSTELYFFTPNFHNSALDTTIGLGVIGVIGYLAVLLTACFAFLNRALDPRVSGTIAALMFMLTLSSAVDLVFMQYNSLPTILMFYLFLVGGRRSAASRRRVPAAPASASRARFVEVPA